jgi:F-type H+-transporting ATPase subunit alpha
MVATLNQPQYAPWPVEEQVVAIFAGTRGYLDDIPTDQVPRFQDELREFLRSEGSVYKEIRESGELSDELTKRIEDQIEKFKNSFNIQEERSLVA